jgi:hypothetical protein
MKFLKFKRSGIGLIPEFCGIPNRFPNKASNGLDCQINFLNTFFPINFLQIFISVVYLNSFLINVVVPPAIYFA